jgi:centrin-1
MMTVRPSENETRDEVHKVFVTYDIDKTGFITLQNLRKVAKDLGELTDDNVLQEMIERADTDGDNRISEE